MSEELTPKQRLEVAIENSVPTHLPKHFMDLKHRRIVNPEGQPIIILNGHLYWFGSGRYIGPVTMLKPTCPKEYFFCDYCGGTFTQRFSASEDEMSLAKHYEMEHRDVVVQKIPQPKGMKGGFWTPSEDAIHQAARALAGDHPETTEKDPMPVIKPVESLVEANKKPEKHWKQGLKEPAASK